MEEDRGVTTRVCSAYVHPLEMVKSFQYLARVILPVDDDCSAVVRKLSRVRSVWKRMTIILSR